MALSCDWAACSSGADAVLLASYSSGELSTQRVREGSLEQTDRWRAHELEAWMAVGHPAEVRIMRSCT